MKILQQYKSAKTLKKIEFIGSKEERAFYRRLKCIFGNRNVIHHDYNIVFPLEIDISIPNKKIAICWDGVCHRKPIFGQKVYKNMVRNDIIRKRDLKKKGWKHIIIEDNENFTNENKVQLADIVKNIYFNNILGRSFYLTKNSIKYYTSKSLCPVCNKCFSNKAEVSKHLKDLILYEEKYHTKFMEKQYRLIKKLLVDGMDYESILKRNDIFCLTLFMKMMLKYSNFKQFLKKNRKDNIKQQYINGRRIKDNVPKISKNILSKKKQDKIKELFKSSYTLKEISIIIPCKTDTIRKYWKKHFSNEDIHIRGRKTFMASRKIKLTKNNKKELRLAFYQNYTKNELVKKFGISVSTINSFFRKNFSKEEIKERTLRIEKLKNKEF